MTHPKRPAPDPEWVLMYRQGIPAAKIAAGAGVAGSVVRYHLALAVKQDPDLRAEHQKALPPPPPRLTAAGQRTLEELLAFHAAEGRLPVAGRDARESKLAGWLARRRKEAAAGALSPAHAHALEAIPGWRDQPTKRDADAARWERRLTELAAWLAAGNDWPRHQKTDDQQERTLGVWLHTQRIDYRAGKLSATKEAQLNKVIPGWREGRPRRGANSSRPPG
ncbi:helicase associated domain-containing protein [Pseudarthrobacter sp. efr-133-R2A-89]|uniref:helicase associated domain-containing protein n=1 Tax=Pseudarthrobacter sp. efr-133-R2A-89 TaxID=3040302 RepID=UPI002555EFE8|nr:helicase associated domain-containing protein [Pseudarthrobacter sp. efr-133-R2A-89]